MSLREARHAVADCLEQAAPAWAVWPFPVTVERVDRPTVFVGLVEPTLDRWTSCGGVGDCTVTLVVDPSTDPLVAADDLDEMWHTADTALRVRGWRVHDADAGTYADRYLYRSLTVEVTI